MSEDIRNFTLSPIPLSEVSHPKSRLFEDKESVTIEANKDTPEDRTNTQSECQTSDSQTEVKLNREKLSKNKILKRKDFLISELTNMSKQSILDNYNLNVRLHVKPKFYQQFARNKKPSCRYMLPYLAMKNRPEDGWRSPRNSKKSLENGNKYRGSTMLSERSFQEKEVKSVPNRPNEWKQSVIKSCKDSDVSVQLEEDDGGYWVDRGDYETDYDDECGDDDDNDNDDNFDDADVSECLKNISLTGYGITDIHEVYKADSEIVNIESFDSEKVTGISPVRSYGSFKEIDSDSDKEIERKCEHVTPSASHTSFKKYMATNGDFFEDINEEDTNQNNYDVITNVTNGNSLHSDQYYVGNTLPNYNRLLRECNKNYIENVPNDRHQVKLSTNEISTKLLDEVSPIVDFPKPPRKKIDNAACRRQLKLHRTRPNKKRVDLSFTEYYNTNLIEKEENENPISTRNCIINDSVMNFRHKRVDTKKSNDVYEVEHVRRVHAPVKPKLSTVNTKKRPGDNFIVDFESVRIASHLHRLQKHASVVGTELGYKTDQTLYSKCWSSVKKGVPVVDEQGFRTVVTGCAVK